MNIKESPFINLDLVNQREQDQEINKLIRLNALKYKQEIKPFIKKI